MYLYIRLKRNDAMCHRE